MKLYIKVIPSSSRDCIVGWLQDTLKIKVKAPAEKGKANKAVIKLLEKNLNLTKGSVQISSGSTSTRKILLIEANNDDGIHKKLSDLCNK